MGIRDGIIIALESRSRSGHAILVSRNVQPTVWWRVQYVKLGLQWCRRIATNGSSARVNCVEHERSGILSYDANTWNAHRGSGACKHTIKQSAASNEFHKPRDAKTSIVLNGSVGRRNHASSSRRSHVWPKPSSVQQRSLAVWICTLAYNEYRA